MSNDFENLFVAGRGISADYMSQGAFTRTGKLLFNGRRSC